MKCNSCNVEFADGLAQCPGCRKKYPKHFSITKLIVLVFGVGFAYLVFFAERSPLDRSSAANADSAKNVSWEYSTYKNKMTGKDRALAISTGQENLNFKFPYSGKNLPTLTVRKESNDIDVLLQIEKGQFVCLSKCKVSIKFDDKSPVNFSAQAPDDGSSNALFLNPASAIVSSLKASKTALVQATFYQEGDRVMLFRTDGLVLKE